MTAARSLVNAQTIVDAIGLGAVYALMAVGIGLVFGVLRLVNFAYGAADHGRRVHARAHRDWPVAVEHPRLLRRRDRALAAMERVVFRPLRDARRRPCSSRRSPSRSCSRRRDARRPARRPARRGRDLDRAAQPGDQVGGVDVRKITIVALVAGARRPRRARAAADRTTSACTCARRRPTSDGPPARRARQPRHRRWPCSSPALMAARSR